MRKIAGLAMLAAVLAGCATVERTERAEDAWSPSALVRWHEARCENVAGRTTPVTATQASQTEMDRASRRMAYYDCVERFP